MNTAQTATVGIPSVRLYCTGLRVLPLLKLRALPGWAPGMPEEMVTIWKLWRRGYAAVAVGPLDGGGDWRCYATGMDEEELEVPEVPEVHPPAPAFRPAIISTSIMFNGILSPLPQSVRWSLP